MSLKITIKIYTTHSNDIIDFYNISVTFWRPNIFKADSVNLQHLMI